jgi:hypothetical protein
MHLTQSCIWMWVAIQVEDLPSVKQWLPQELFLSHDCYVAMKMEHVVKEKTTKSTWNVDSEHSSTQNGSVQAQNYKYKSQWHDHII